MDPSKGSPVPRPGAAGKAGSKIAALWRRPGVRYGALAGAVVVVYALFKRGGGLGGDATAGDPSTLNSDQLQRLTGAATYDSTANDVYNSIQPQLDALSQQLEAIGKTPGPAGPAGPAGPKGPAGSAAPKPTKPKPTKPKPATKTKSITIGRGDSLQKIAKKYGVSMAQIKKLNPVFWSNPKYHGGKTIFAGGHVKVPVKK